MIRIKIPSFFIFNFTLTPFILTLLLLTVFIVSCSSGIKVNTLTHDPAEGIVIGKISVFLNDTNVTSNSILYFNENVWGTYGIEIENEDYFLIKLPEGKNHLHTVFTKLSKKHTGLRYFFPENKTTFNIDSTKINYIGDIKIDRTGPDEGPSAILLGGAVGGYKIATTQTGHTIITTENNTEKVREFIKTNFSKNTNKVNVSLLAGEVVSEKTSSPEPAKTTEAKLIELKKIYEHNLITKKEYDQKRKELLDKI